MPPTNYSFHVHQFFFMKKVVLLSLLILFAYPFMSFGQSSFAANVNAGCTPLTATFTPTSTNVQSYNWTFTGGNPATSNIASPTVSYGIGGAYPVTLVITHTNGQVETLSYPAYIQAHTPPTANFTATPTNLCVGQCVTFTSTSTAGAASGGAIDSLKWDFGDGMVTSFMSANMPPMTHCYLGVGNFPVTLIIKDVYGCVDAETKPNYIHVDNPLNANFTFTQPPSCNPPINISFTSATNQGVHNWSFGTGQGTSTQINPSHIYNASGAFIVTHSVTTANGCTTTATQTVQLSQTAPVISAPPAPFCSNTPLTFNWNQVPGSGILWDFGANAIPQTSNAVNPSVIFTNGGMQTITAQMTDSLTGCQSSATLTVNVQQSPTVTFVATTPTTSCNPPLTVSFNGTGTSVTSWLWDFGDGGTSTLQNPSHLYSQVGAYHVQLTVTSANGCTYSLTQPSFVKIFPPVVDFTASPLQGCAPLTTTFSDLTIASNPITNWNWSFFGGNPSVSTVQNPTVNYTNTGNYTVRLIVTDTQGCKDTLIKTSIVKVGSLPNVNFAATPTTACATTPIIFTNLSSPSGVGVFATWFFDYGNPNSPVSGMWNPVQVYADTGYFNVMLVITNQGCKDTLIMDSMIHIIPPVAKFSANPAPQNNYCKLPCTMLFNNQSIAADSFAWAIVTNNIPVVFSNVANAQYTFTQAGTYTILFTAYNKASGCFDTLSKVIKILPVTATFLFAPNDPANQICAPLPIIFGEQCINATIFNWNFGDGTGWTNIQNPIHVYQNVGVYYPMLIASNSLGCKDTFQLVAPSGIVANGAAVSFVADTTRGCPGLTAQFTSTSTAFSGVQACYWEYGDGSPIEVGTISPPHTFPANPDSFDVTLYVLDNAGCIDTLTIPNMIMTSKPNAQFSSPNLVSCINHPIAFVSNSTGNGLSYAWDFGDGATAGNIAQVTHNYIANNTYSPTLYVKDANGCPDTATMSNYIYIGSITANFVPSATSATCPPLTSCQTPFVNPPFSTANASYAWTTTSGASSALPTPCFVYNIPGIYSIGMTITIDGCSTSVALPNIINIQGPVATYSITPDNGCPGTTANINILTTNNVVAYYWNLGATTSTLPNPSITYNIPGTYTPVLTVKDVNGCAVPMLPANDSIIIFTPPTANFTGDSLFVCIPSVVTFDNNSTNGSANITSSYWTYGEPSPQTIPNAGNSTHTYLTGGLKDISLIVTDANGCKDTLVREEYVKVIPNVPPTVPPIQSVSVINDHNIRIVFSKYPNTLEDFGQYLLYREPEGLPAVLIKNINNILDTIYVDTVVNASTSHYCYYLKFISRCGNLSAQGTKHCTINAKTVPLPDALHLTWTPYKGWAVKQYNIYRVQDYGMQGQIAWDIVPGTDTSYVDESMFCTVPVTYRVEAVELGGNGNSSKSDTSKMAPYHLNSLTSVHTTVASVQNDHVLVKWAIPENIGHLKNIIVSRNDGNGYENIAEIAPNKVSYQDDEANVWEKSYQYKISILDSCDDITPLGRTGKTMLFRAFQYNGSVRFNWTPYVEWQDNVKSYLIELKDLGSNTYIPIMQISGNDTTFVDYESHINQDKNCYRVRALEKNGNNQSSLSNEVCVDLHPLIYVPTAFSPNGDGVNDVFYTKGTFLREYEIKIVDKWGNLLFQSTSPDAIWDGTYKGQPVPEGVYSVKVHFVGTSGFPDDYAGTVSVIR